MSLTRTVALPSLRPRRSNRLRRPPNAFIIFRVDQLPRVRSLYPYMSAAEISFTLGEMWRDLNEIDKHRYVRLAVSIRNYYRFSSFTAMK